MCVCMHRNWMRAGVSKSRVACLENPQLISSSWEGSTVLVLTDASDSSWRLSLSKMENAVSNLQCFNTSVVIIVMSFDYYSQLLKFQTNNNNKSIRNSLDVVSISEVCSWKLYGLLFVSRSILSAKRYQIGEVYWLECSYFSKALKSGCCLPVGRSSTHSSLNSEIHKT